MNAIVPASNQGGSAALVPRSMSEAMDLATMMAKTGFLARELQTPGGALFVVEQSMRWNMSPFAVAMETSFIQGKPMFSGKIVAAAVVSMGAVSGRLSYEYSGKGDDRTVIVRGTVRGESEPREVIVRAGDAKTNNKVWVSQQDQQLAYHGARVWARRHTPEVMLGVWAPEEFDEPAPMPPASGPTIAGQAERAPMPMDLIALNSRAEPVTFPSVDSWLRYCRKALDMLESTEAVREWMQAMRPHIEAAPDDAAEKVRDAAAARVDALTVSVDHDEENAA